MRPTLHHRIVAGITKQHGQHTAFAIRHFHHGHRVIDGPVQLAFAPQPKHDFPNLELVVSVDVDQGITSLNSSAVEEMGQQLIQVAGRAGRSDGNATVLVQSRYVNDQNLLQLKSGNYLNFAKSLMEQRQATNQPPYTFEATIKASSPKAQTNIEMLTYAKQFIDASKCVLIGPIPAMQSKVRG